MNVISYDEYKQYIACLLKPLRQREAQLFCASCLSFLYGKYVAILRSDISADEFDLVEKLKEKSDKLLSSDAQEDIPVELYKCLSVVGFDDSGDPYDLHTHSITVLSALDFTLQSVLEPTTVNLVQVAELMTDTVDYELSDSEPGYVTDSLEKMFTYPKMKVMLESLEHLVVEIRKGIEGESLLKSLSKNLHGVKE